MDVVDPELPAQSRQAEPLGGDDAPVIRTFMIADVRGYTLFTQERGDEAAAKLASKFAAIAKEGVEARGGQVIELRGDEALAVFASARQAIRAAVDLQAMFVKETIGDPGLPLRVGIGLDAGEAVPVEGGYRGGALNLAARLCGQAGPGETLASQGVTHLARRVEGVRYVDRGELQMKGLEEPVHAVRVLPEGADPALQLAPYGPKLPPPRPRRRVAGVPWVIVSVGVVLIVGPLSAIFLRNRLSTTSTHATTPAPPTSRSNTLWRIDPDTARRIATIAVGDAPGAVAVGEGSIWTANQQGETVSRIDPVTNKALTINVGRGPTAIALAQGYAWVILPDAKAVVRIDPNSNTAGPPIALGNRPAGITTANGSVWVTHSDGITQIDPGTSTIVRNILVPGSVPVR